MIQAGQPRYRLCQQPESAFHHRPCNQRAQRAVPEAAVQKRLANKAVGSADQLGALKKEIAAFNEMFDTVTKGDRIVLDYAPGAGTTVLINSEQKGTIAGKEFNDLLLSIWLGDKPISKKLRDGLLGK